MNKENFNISNMSLLIIFCLFVILPLPWNDALDDQTIDMYFKINTTNNKASDLVIVYIGDNEAKALGGWPIPRNYYAYITHILNSSGAKVIGFDILFNKPDLRYSEYDNDLAAFFKAAGNVCLPMTFSEIKIDPNAKEFPELMRSENPTFPLKKLKNNVIGVGTSNFGNVTIIHKVPIVVNYKDSILSSFGFELARHFLDCTDNISLTSNTVNIYNKKGKQYSIPVDKYNRLRLNQLGSIDNFQTISFIELLKLFENNPESINLKDKLVIVAVTVSGSIVKATPLTSKLPATFIHATVAENIIHQNFIYEFSKYVHCFIILILVILGNLIWRLKSKTVSIIIYIATLIFYSLFSILAFRYFKIAFPLFYPVIAYLTTIGYLEINQLRQKYLQHDSMQSLLNKQIKTKVNELKKAKSQLAEVKIQLEQETTISEQTKHLAEDREKDILKLEKDLRDLNAHTLPKTNQSNIQFDKVIHASNSKMTQVLELVTKVSSDNIPVLILGETGTGKEVIAHTIHQIGKRKDAAFIAINCGALPETLLESELFGHERGSFTGAHARRKGRFEQADGGTIFLDEITETTPAFQSRLLRVLQEGTFERLGGEQTLKVDVRVITATNKKLHTEMETGRFRTDLFYRLNGFPINLPLLQDRIADIPLLANHFLKKHGYKTVSAFSDRVMEVMQKYNWPGNVRELENFVRRAAILAQSEERYIIQESDLPDEIQKFEEEMIEIKSNYKSFENQLIESMRSLKFSRSAITQTAKILGDRDRGTITEYFRGICFEHLKINDFQVNKAAAEIAGTDDVDVVDRVVLKINSYLKNISNNINDDKKLLSSYKGLPKKYHSYLDQVIEHFK